jgi:hypothetical protein
VEVLTNDDEFLVNVEGIEEQLEVVEEVVENVDSVEPCSTFSSGKNSEFLSLNSSRAEYS